MKAEAKTLTLRVPSWRGDLEREIDLIEEVARCYGYEKIPADADVTMRMGTRDEVLTQSTHLAHILTAAGFSECVTFSFTNAELAGLVNPWTDAAPLAVRNPIDQAHPLLRTSLVPSLMATRRLNQDRRNRDVRLFELAHVYLPKGEGALPDERLMLGLVADCDFRTMKGVLETVLDRFGLVNAATFEDVAMAFLSEGLALSVDGERIGYMGTPSDAVLARFDLKTSVTVGEVDFASVMSRAGRVPGFAELPRFPEITRDLAVVVEDAVRWADVEKALTDQDVPLLESVTFASEFRSKEIGAGKKSVAFSMVFRAADRTLTREDADAAQKTLLDAIATSLGATLRG